MRKQKVLFLCTQNSVRSQMAEEGFLREHAGDRFEAFSAGCEYPALLHGECVPPVRFARAYREPVAPRLGVHH